MSVRRWIAILAYISSGGVVVVSLLVAILLRDGLCPDAISSSGLEAMGRIARDAWPGILLGSAFAAHGYAISHHWTKTPRWRTGAAIGVALGLLAAGVASYIAWQENPQDEFHGPDGVKWDAWLPISLSWFVFIGVPASAACAGSLSLVGRLRRRERRRARNAAGRGEDAPHET